jgi:D-amino-acid dehydrogenase
MPKSKTIAVVGAGIAGVSCALHLLRDGHRVTLIDRGDPGKGCSFGNAGFISPGTATPRATPDALRQVPGWLLDAKGPLRVRWTYALQAAPWLWRFVRAGRPETIAAGIRALQDLHGQAFDIYDGLIDTSGLIRRLGQLHIFETDTAFAAAQKLNEQRRARGVAVEELDPDALRQMAPELGPACRHALLFPENGHTVSPYRLVRTLADRFVADGGSIRQRDVTRFAVVGGTVTGVDTNRGPLLADHVVVAAGAWSARLARDIGDRIPLETQRGYHLELPEPGLSLRIGMQSVERKFTITPMEDGLRLAGTAEFAGLDAAPDYRRARALFGHASRLLPGLKDEGARQWMGHRPCTPDSLPVIDRATRHANVHYAFGHGHTGLSGAPMTGQLIAEMVAGRATSIDAAAFRLGRF